MFFHNEEGWGRRQDEGHVHGVGGHPNVIRNVASAPLLVLFMTAMFLYSCRNLRLALCYD